MNDDSNKLLENLMGILGDNPSEKLGQILSGLSGNTQKAQEETNDSDSSQPETNNGFDPTMLIKMQSLMGQLNQQDTDERCALLAAIRPFLNAERQPQVDQAIKLLKLTKLAKTAQDMDLFKGLL